MLEFSLYFSRFEKRDNDDVGIHKADSLDPPITEHGTDRQQQHQQQATTTSTTKNRLLATGLHRQFYEPIKATTAC